MNNNSKNKQKKSWSKCECRIDPFDKYENSCVISFKMNIILKIENQKNWLKVEANLERFIVHETIFLFDVASTWCMIWMIPGIFPLIAQFSDCKWLHINWIWNRYPESNLFYSTLFKQSAISSLHWWYIFLVLNNLIEHYTDRR